MITNGKKWHCLVVKSLSALLRAITSNHVGDFSCLNCFDSYSTKEKLKKHEKVCNNHDYCYVEMPDEHNKMLKYNHAEKLLKAQFMIYADLECLLEKMHLCQNNLEKSYTELLIGYSLFTSCLFDPTKNKLDCYRDKDCIEKFCKNLKEHATRIINYEKKRSDTTDR